MSKAHRHSKTSSVSINMSHLPTTDQSRRFTGASTFDVTVLISGSGTNLQALIEACARSSTIPNARITHVISNRKDAYGLTRAEQAHIPTTYHNLVSYKRKQPDTEAGVKAARAKYDSDLAQLILTHIPCPDLVVCAGWMHILTASFINALQSASVPIINLHPALPGAFSGADAIGRAFEAFQQGKIKKTGVMIHKVVGEVDMGEPVFVKEVEMKRGEPKEQLEKRIHQTEWMAIVEGVRVVLKGLERERQGGGR